MFVTTAATTPTLCNLIIYNNDFILELESMTSFKTDFSNVCNLHVVVIRQESEGDSGTDCLLHSWTITVFLFPSC